MEKGLIHIYTGDGKGKTTAATGLAVRFAGDGGRVLFTQFLKDGTSSEITALKAIENIKIYSFTEHLGFSYRMNDEQRTYAAKCYTEYLNEIIHIVSDDSYGLLILDEIIGAYNLNFVDHSVLLSFLEQKPENLEVVLTGRNPDAALLQKADYVSEIRKVKHPFDQGIMAREGIEY